MEILNKKVIMMWLCQPCNMKFENDIKWAKHCKEKHYFNPYKHWRI